MIKDEKSLKNFSIILLILFSILVILQYTIYQNSIETNKQYNLKMIDNVALVLEGKLTEIFNNIETIINLTTYNDNDNINILSNLNKKLQYISGYHIMKNNIFKSYDTDLNEIINIQDFFLIKNGNSNINYFYDNQNIYISKNIKDGTFTISIPLSILKFYINEIIEKNNHLKICIIDRNDMEIIFCGKEGDYSFKKQLIDKPFKLIIKIDDEDINETSLMMFIIISLFSLFFIFTIIFLLYILKHKISILKEKNNDLEFSINNRDKFLSLFSHELRTPLNAIIGFSDVMRQEMYGKMMPKYQEYSRHIYDSGIQLLDLVNDILDYGRMLSGKIEMKPEKFNIIEIINKTVELNSNKNIMVDFEFCGNNDIIFDKKSFSQIVINLFSNSVKYCNKNEPKVIFKTYNSGNYLILEIIDNGIGISENKMKKLFEPFIIENYKNVSSIGLGLSIVKNLIDTNNGKINCFSSTSGTKMKLFLPKK